MHLSETKPLSVSLLFIVLLANYLARYSETINQCGRLIKKKIVLIAKNSNQQSAFYFKNNLPYH